MHIMCCVCCVVYVMLLHVVAYDMLCYVMYDGKPWYVMIRQTTLCYDMVSNVMIQQQHVL